MSVFPLDPIGAGPGGFRRKCLFAVTILLVEDSRSASEAIRLFAGESGARLRRADSLHAAARHLAIYRPNVAIVDLGLPDGDGLALIAQLASASTPIQGIVALSGNDRERWREEARESGADTCLEKPIESLRAFQETILSVLPDAESRRGPDEARVALGDRASIRTALVQDLSRARSLQFEARECRDDETGHYCRQFVGSVGEMLGDTALVASARAGWGAASAPALLALLQARLGGGEAEEVRGVA